MDGDLEDLVARARNGDFDAFAALVQGELSRLHRLAWIITGDFHVGQDVVQDSLFAAYSRLWQLEDDLAFGAWLTRIIVNRARNEARRVLRRATHPVADDSLAEWFADPQMNPILQSEGRWMRSEVARLVDGLPTRQRQILRAVAAGEPVTSAAAALGITPGAARTALHRARAALRANLQMEGLWIAESAPPVRGRKGMTPGMKRAELAKRLEAIGMELREETAIIDVGRAVDTEWAEIDVGHVLCDAGVVLVVWRSRPHPAMGGRIELHALSREGSEPVVGLGNWEAVHGRGTWEDGWCWGRAALPGGDAMAPVALTFLLVNPGDLPKHVADVAVSLPGWDGGLASVPMPIRYADVRVRGYAMGGLGGRAAVEIRRAPEARGGVTFIRGIPDFLRPKFAPDSVDAFPLQKGETQPPLLTGESIIGATQPDANLRLDRRPSLAEQVSYFGVGMHGRSSDDMHHREWILPRVAPPFSLTMPHLIRWEAVGPVLFSLGAEHQGGPWEVSLPGEAGKLQVRVDGVDRRPRTFPGGRQITPNNLRWSFRVLSDSASECVPGMMVWQQGGKGRGIWAHPHGNAGLNGWRHLGTPMLDDRIIMAVVALGAQIGPFDLPFPQLPAPVPTLPVEVPDGDSLVAAVGRMMPDGMAVDPDLEAILNRVEAYFRYRVVLHARLPHVLAELLDSDLGFSPHIKASFGLSHPAPLLAFASRTLRADATPKAGPMEISKDLRVAITEAIAEARETGRSVVGRDEIFLGMLRSRTNEGLDDVGLDLDIVRRVLWGGQGDSGTPA